MRQRMAEIRVKRGEFSFHLADTLVACVHLSNSVGGLSVKTHMPRKVPTPDCHRRLEGRRFGRFDIDIEVTKVILISTSRSRVNAQSQIPEFVLLNIDCLASQAILRVISQH
jgi:hypothetical protein